MWLTRPRFASTLFDVIGSRLRTVRKKAELSTKELDRLAGLTAGHTWAVENSKSGNADTVTLDKIAAVLGLSLDYLVRGEGREPGAAKVRAAIETARASLASNHRRTGTIG